MLLLDTALDRDLFPNTVSVWLCQLRSCWLCLIAIMGKHSHINIGTNLELRFASVK